MKNAQGVGGNANGSPAASIVGGSLVHLYGRLFNTPLMIHQPKLEAILHGVGGRIVGSEFFYRNTSGELDFIEVGAGFNGAYEDQNQGTKRQYQLTDSGIAIIPVEGTLFKKLSGMAAWSGGCTYSQLANQMRAAVNDSAVRGILLDIDSPGGETHGAFELSDLIYSMRGSKPIYASANDLAASAAYAIGSACNRLYVTRTGAVGSIGVYSLHCEVSGADTKAGVKYTYIYAGEDKVAGNPHEPLSEGAAANAQTEVDRQYKLFVNTVARNRKLKAADVIGTKAQLRFADAGLPMLCDAVGTLEDALAALEEKVGVVKQKGSTTVRVVGSTAELTINGTSFVIAAAAPMQEDDNDPDDLDSSASSEDDPDADADADNDTGTDTDNPASDPDDPTSDKDNQQAPGKSAPAKMSIDFAKTIVDKIVSNAHTQKEGIILTMNPTTATITAEQIAAAQSILAAAGVAAIVPAPVAAASVPAAAAPTPVPAAALPAVAPAASGPTAADVQAVIEMCTIAGKLDQIAPLSAKLNAGSTVADIRKDLVDLRARDSAAAGSTSAHISGKVSVGALDELDAKAEAMANESGGKITKAAAYVKLLTRNPKMYAAVKEETTEAVRVNPNQYLSQLGARFPTGNFIEVVR